MLKISRSNRNNKLDAEKAGRMAKLAEEQEALITAIEEEKLHMTDLEREIRRIEKQVRAATNTNENSNHPVLYWCSDIW